MSFHSILMNKLLEFTSEEFGTKGRTKPTRGKLVRKKQNKTSALIIFLLFFNLSLKQGCQTIKVAGSEARGLWV